MSAGEETIPEEVVGLNYHFLPPDRQSEVEQALEALCDDTHLEFLLAVFDVTINDRPLPRTAPASRTLLNKLLQALDGPEGISMLYESPYNELTCGAEMEREARIEWWNFDLAQSLLEFSDLRSVRAFLQHGTSGGRERSPARAQELHDLLLRGLVGDETGHAIWSCSDIRVPGEERRVPGRGSGEEVWPAQDVSPWFYGVFWDDLIVILSPAESTLTLLALTSY
jgi:hypothetical protein